MKEEVQREIDKGKKKRCGELLHEIDNLRHERAVLDYEESHSLPLGLTWEERAESRKRKNQLKEEIKNKTSDLLALNFGNNRVAAAKFTALNNTQWQDFERKNQDTFKGDAEYRATLHLQQRQKYPKIKKQLAKYPAPGLRRNSYQPWKERKILAAERSRKTFQKVYRKSFSGNQGFPPFPILL